MKKFPLISGPAASQTGSVTPTSPSIALISQLFSWRRRGRRVTRVDCLLKISEDLQEKLKHWTTMMEQLRYADITFETEVRYTIQNHECFHLLHWCAGVPCDITGGRGYRWTAEFTQSSLDFHSLSFILFCSEVLPFSFYVELYVVCF